MNDRKIDRKFTAKIENRDGWICLAWDESVVFFGTSRAIKVIGTIDDVPFQTAFLPRGDGTQFLPVSKKLQKLINKQPGGSVQVHLLERV